MQRYFMLTCLNDSWFSAILILSSSTGTSFIGLRKMKHLLSYQFNVSVYFSIQLSCRHNQFTLMHEFSISGKKYVYE